MKTALNLLLAAILFFPACSGRDTDRYNISAKGAPRTGPDNPPVTVIVFNEFQCPYGEKGYRFVEELRLKHENEIAVVSRHFPLQFHKMAEPAARASIAAWRQGKFPEMQKALFDNRKNLNENIFEKLALETGLDTAQFRKDMQAPESSAIIKSDMEMAQRFGVRGTPAFFINGRSVRGADTRTIGRVVAEELTNGKKSAEKKIPDIYSYIVKRGLDRYVPTENEKRVKERKGRTVTKDIYRVNTPSSVPATGDVNSPLTLIFFTDYECPYCSAMLAEIKKLEEKYSGKIRLYVMDFPLPFHGMAKPAARTARAAGKQGKFREMFFHLHENQAEWANPDMSSFFRAQCVKYGLKWQDVKTQAGNTSRKSLLSSFFKAASEKNINKETFKKELAAADEKSFSSYAPALALKMGLDRNVFMKDYASQEIKDELETHILSGRETGIRGTPSLFINGRFISGLYPADKLAEIAEEELKRAEPYIKKGLAGDILYSELVKDGRNSIEKPQALKK